MLDLLWRATTIDPVVMAILAGAAVALAAISAIPLAPRTRNRPSRAVKVTRWSLVALIGLVGYVGLANGLERLGKRPEAIYVMRQGDEMRIAVAGDSGHRGPICLVRTTTLDRRLIGRDTLRRRCRVFATSAWADEGASMRAIDLWEGRFDRPLSAHATEQGPLPGSGAMQVVAVGDAAVTVRLQDGTTRSFLGPSSEGIVRMSTNEEPMAFPPTGVHEATVVQHDCCDATRCGTLISFSDVAFGPGQLHLGLVRDAAQADEQPQLVWSIATRELFGTEAAITGAFSAPGDERCVAIAGLPGFRVGVAFFDMADGTVSRVAIH